MALLLAACGEPPAGPPPPALDAPVVLPVQAGGSDLMVQASVNGGTPETFIVDSGLTGTHVLGRDTAERLGLEQHGFALVGSWAGLGMARFTRVESLGLGGLELRGLPMAVVGLPPGVLARDGGVALAGFLGQPLFDAYAVTVDVPAGTLTLSPPGGPVPEGAITLPLLPGPMPLVELRVDGQPVRLSIDTGAATSDITLYEDVAERLGLRARYGEGRRSRALAAAGEVEFEKLTVGEVRVGPQRLPKVELDIVPRATLWDRLFPGDWDGVVGLGLLAQYRFTLDIPRGRLVLVPLTTHDSSFWQRLEDKSAAPQ
ncbi:hypothetical protein HHL28_16750 [Aerophototrophica crusticola]|uniref:Peptidase A2 domain-containing protein n=1 Tax=Aerophototrophica crusticola TaxID=1709002 RepID=A0A858RAS1_9PROT|nr:hypothetical protein HHL28_16750 [Rhodospirillaceae bacterium B3]